MKKAITAIIAVAIIALMALGYADAAAHRAHSGGGETEVDPQEIIFDHLGDAYGWEVPFNHSQRIPLPVIVRAQDGSWHAFMSSRLENGAQYDGFQIAEGGDYNNKVVQMMPDGSQYRPLDLSITKNVAGIFIAALKAGKMSYVADGSTVERDIHGGVADVKDNVVSVCLY